MVQFCHTLLMVKPFSAAFKPVLIDVDVDERFPKFEFRIAGYASKTLNFLRLQIRFKKVYIWLTSSRRDSIFKCQKVVALSDAVCDGTKNVKRYRYRYFFPVPNIFDTGTFFGTDTGSETFYRYRFRDFFRYQFFPIPSKKWVIAG